ncbi:ribosomal protein S18-alanine N-acetyltransferase [Helicovermis profundi]|uniref:[Ribosomal protein bS18]-alanine N-acetyltransferase n=1 Tax=Helicovermis profundi TaxID=3065157 RepID=A0AAU9ESA1_9FIRM|nr:ribosomal protein S18-alanine N-acetyltransferase [Clostridia bacterium S502]
MSNIAFRKMRISDIDMVYQLEVESFSVPWGAETFVRELTENKLAHYYVLLDNDEVIGYGGMWFIVDEAHITNIAVRKKRRGYGYGKKITSSLIDVAKESNMFRITLEVRESNSIAIGLYEKLGFISVGIRPNYYQDNKENAVIMWKELL